MTPPDITGSTPRVLDNCPNSLCEKRPDGNYEISGEENHFVQCFDSLAYCQPCWPSNLIFSGKCNQCLYERNGDCVTTTEWLPATTFSCPDLCPDKGAEFNGNIADPNNRRHYVGCWEGVTVGCVACPGVLEFNENWNACLYEGKYKTEPSE